jgi:hypothetical protein
VNGILGTKYERAIDMVSPAKVDNCMLIVVHSTMWSPNCIFQNGSSCIKYKIHLT